MDDFQYALTPTEGLVRCLSEPHRGRYFVMTEGGPLRIKSRPSPEYVAKVMARNKCVHPDKGDDELVRAVLSRALKVAQHRGRKSGREITITVDDAVRQFEAQGRRCSLTGMAIRMLFSGPERVSRRNPYGPSIDRIDVQRGYVPDNIRITTVIANMSRGDFGDAVFLNMCRHTAAFHGNGG